MAKSEEQVNVKVAVRSRPFNTRENKNNATKVLNFENGDQISIINPKPVDPRKKETKFTFDHSYDDNTPQETVYQDLGAPLLAKAMEGYNATIFAYGQTGSGKTFSMNGYNGNEGITPRMNSHLFEQIEKSPMTKRFLVTVSYLEIYNEKIQDLLNPNDKELKVREHPQLGIYVDGLASLVVGEMNDVMRLMEQGNKVRMVAATNMNDTSSRSHSVFTIKIEQKDESRPDWGLRSKINLVDLAGSERANSTGATGARLKEGAMINKSLAALGNVINALADPKKRKSHIPYRDSKLTRILQESLGGNTLTVMLAALSPADMNYDETLSTLNYANRAKNIQNNSKKNEDENQRIIRELRQEISDLRSMLSKSDSGTDTSEQMAKMAMMIENLEMAKNQTWEQTQKQSEQFQVERNKNLADKGLLEWVMTTIKEGDEGIQIKLDKLKRIKDSELKMFKEAKTSAEKHKESLQVALEKLAQYQMEGCEDAVFNACKTEIDDIKVNLKAANERVKQMKKLVKEATENLRIAKEEAVATQLFLNQDHEIRKMIQDDERKRLEKQNMIELDNEKKRLKKEMDAAKKDLENRMRNSGSSTMTIGDQKKIEMEIIELRSKCAVLNAENEGLKENKERLVNDLEETHLRFEAQIEAQQLANFEAFRRYRYEFEQEQIKREKKFQEILERALKDSLFLTSSKHDVEQENDRLRKLIGNKVW